MQTCYPPVMGRARIPASGVATRATCFFGRQHEPLFAVLGSFAGLSPLLCPCLGMPGRYCQI